MSISPSSIMAMFSFTKVENWRTVNFLPKCTRLHKIASQISQFSRGWYPGPSSMGRGTPPPHTSPPRGLTFLSSQGFQSLNPALYRAYIRSMQRTMLTIVKKKLGLTKWISKMVSKTWWFIYRNEWSVIFSLKQLGLFYKHHIPSPIPVPAAVGQ